MTREAQLGTLEREFLQEIYVGRRSLATREKDRARQRCRRAGWAVYEGKPKQWRITQAGHMVLALGVTHDH